MVINERLFSVRNEKKISINLIIAGALLLSLFISSASIYANSVPSPGPCLPLRWSGRPRDAGRVSSESFPCEEPPDRQTCDTRDVRAGTPEGITFSSVWISQIRRGNFPVSPREKYNSMAADSSGIVMKTLLHVSL